MTMKSEDPKLELVLYTKKLLSTPPLLTAEDVRASIGLVLDILSATNREPSTEDYIKIASFLTAFRATGLDHKAEFIAEAAKAVLCHSLLVELPALNQAEDNDIVLDIVGTGGDGQNTFNVSTSAAIVASGIPGIKILKHGGKASTSNSGAGDLINHLGCNSSKVTAMTVPALYSNKNSFIFLLAPYFHNGMKYVAPIRKMLQIPTIFNVLGPLLHPVVKRVQKRVLGVYSKELATEYAKAAQLVYPGNEIFIVWGHIGLDEVSPIGKTTVWHMQPGRQAIETFEIEPADFGLQEHSLEECASMGAEANATFLRDRVLAGKIHYGDHDPIYDYILLNTALLYCLSQGHRNWTEGVLKAEESIHSGESLKSLRHFIDDVNSL